MPTEQPMGEDSWELTDEMADLAADLVTDHPEFVRRLRHYPIGQWVAVEELCTGIYPLPTAAEHLFERIGEDFVVARLGWPGSEEPELDVLILFFHGPEFWSTHAYYNARTLDRA
jgi:hypothetical protein